MIYYHYFALKCIMRVNLPIFYIHNYYSVTLTNMLKSSTLMKTRIELRVCDTKMGVLGEGVLTA